jgi:hypothetical protein
MIPIKQNNTNKRHTTRIIPRYYHLTVTVIFSLAISVVALAKENRLTEIEEAQGWDLLFNGQDMSRWRNYQKESVSDKWVVNNGAMILTGKGAGDLITREKYQDFDLRLDWKISEAGNSGLFILADEEARIIYLHAPEIQMLDNERHRDNKEADHLSGSLYDMMASPASSHRKAGEWNQLRVLLQDKALTVWQNSVKTTEVTIGSNQWHSLIAQSKFKNWEGFGQNTEGFIGLQDHGDPVSFRNIKIRALDK